MAKVKTVMIGDKKYHLPWVDLIPYDEKQLAELRASIQERGRVLEPIVCWKEKKGTNEETVVDGANRVILSAELGLDEPRVRYESFESEEQAEDYAKTMNFDRRQTGWKDMAEWRKERQERIKKVAEMRKEGVSLRTIAEELEVSTAQVQRDLQEAGGENGIPVKPESGKVKGKDGRTQTARPAPAGNKGSTNGKKPEAKEILCSKCKRVGKVKDCPQCAKLQARVNRKPGKTTAAAANGKTEGPKDTFGNELPKDTRAAFSDPWAEDTINRLGAMLDDLRKLRIGSNMDRRKAFLPFVRDKDVIDASAQAHNSLEFIYDELMAHRPSGVCPACQGKKCSHCKMSGLVPRELYKELAKEMKEKERQEKQKAKEEKDQKEEQPAEAAK